MFLENSSAGSNVVKGDKYTEIIRLYVKPFL
jgi:hypothetical protein